MPADVESLFYVGTTPWHGLGKPMPNEVTSEEAIVLAGLDWEVEVAPIVTNDQKRTAIVNRRVTRRLTDSAILGIVPKRFVPIQNREAFKFFDGVMGENKATYHTAGSLQGGSKVWILAKLPGVIEIGKDEVEKYVLLSNSFDGSRPLQMLFTPVRVVCSNTLSMALGKSKRDRVSPRVSIRHNLHKELMLEQAKKLMASAVAYYEKFGDFTNFLAGKQLVTQQVDNIVAKVFPPNRQELVTPAISEMRGEVTRLFDEGKGHDAVAGSAWALVNAFAEFADHGLASKKKHREDRSYSIWFGGARGLKNRATAAVTAAVM